MYNNKYIKFILAFCVVCMLFMAVVSNSNIQSSYAENEYPDHIISTQVTADNDHYMYLNSPTKVAYGNDTIAVYYSNNNIGYKRGSYYGQVSGLQTSLINAYNLNMQIYGNYIFVSYYDERDKLIIIDMSTNTRLPEERMGVFMRNEAYPKALAFDENSRTAYMIFETNIIKQSVNPNDLTTGDSSIVTTIDSGVVINRMILSGNNLYILYHTYIRNILVVPLNNANSKVRYDFDTIDFADQRNIYMGSFDNYIYIGNGKQINLYANNGDFSSVVGALTINYNGLAIYDNKMLLSDHSKSLVDEYDLTVSEIEKKINLNYIASYGHKGDSDTMLNGLSGVAYYENYAILLDYNNNRIVRYTMNENTVVEIKKYNLTGRLSTRPMDITVDSKGNTYVSDDSGTILALDINMNEIARYKMPDGEFANKIVVDAYGVVYCLSGSTNYIYSFSNGEFTLVFSQANTLIVDIDISFLGSVLYYTDNQYIKSYDLLTNEIRSLNVDLTQLGIVDIKKIKTDYKGNLIVMHKKDTKFYITFIERLENEYNLIADISLETSSSVMLSQDLCDFDILPNGDIIVANRNYNILQHYSLVGIFEIATENNDSYDDAVESPEVIVIRTIDNCFAYIKPNNFENRLIISNNVIKVVLATVEYKGLTYYYIDCGEYRAYLPSTSAVVIVNSEPPFALATIRHREAKIYSKPIEDDKYLKYVIDNKSAVINIISRVGYFTNTINLDFVEVNYGDYSGYIKKDRLSIYKEVIYNTTEPIYMKVKANRMGTKIPLYESASSEAVVLTTISDGAKVTLLEEYSKDKEFIKVSFDGIEGYVASKVMYSKGLSSSQVLAIVLIVGVIVISIVLYFVSRRLRTMDY